MIVSFYNYELPPRWDGVPWETIRIEQAPEELGPWELIDTQTIDPVDINPAHPTPRSFSTDNATMEEGWYRVSFLDDLGNIFETEPVYNVPPNEVEILASLDDIRANLDDKVVRATADNTYLLQISVARIIRAYLSNVVENDVLMSWLTPEATPDIIREVAGKLIASQVYLNQASTTSLSDEANSFAQRRYDEAMALLGLIISGEISIGNGDTPPLVPIEQLGPLDFHPIDDTDRAFSMSMEL